MSGGHDYAPARQAPQQAPAEAPALPTPGKRALTDRLSRREPVAPSAERTPARWLPDELRDEKREELQSRVMVAHQNFKLAIASKRLEILLTKSSSWGFMAELVFGLVSYTAVGALVGALARVRKRAIRAITEAEFRGAHGGDASIALFHTIAERINPDRVKDGLAHVGRATRSGIKERSKSIAPHASGKLQLLSVIGNSADHHAIGVLHTLAPSLGDDDLILLIESYDLDAHAFDTYVAAVDDLVSRYESQGVDDIGDQSATGAARGRNAEPALRTRLEAVRFVYRGRERVAVVSRAVLPGEETEGAAPTVDANSLSRCQWHHWIDEDLSGAASAVQEQRVGPTMVINVEAGEIPPTWAPMVSTWIAGVRP